MSDASETEQPSETEEPWCCRECGVILDQDALDADRDLCFDCYSMLQG